MALNYDHGRCSGGGTGDYLSSKSVTETTRGYHDFVITGYSLLKGTGAGRYICSDTFTVGGRNWAIYFYPDGKNPDDNGAYISAFVVLAGEGIDVRALFELTLLDQSGKGNHVVNSQFNRPPESGPYYFKCKGSMWGFKRFYGRTALESSDYLRDDRLVIHCSVGVVMSHIEGPNQYSYCGPPPEIGQNLKKLLDSEIGCDVVFQVGDETFKAHKLVLAARSTVFRKQFFELNGNPGTAQLKLDNIEPLIFKAMLQFIYTDRLPNLHDLAGSTSTTTTKNLIQHLLVVADSFGLGSLKQLCEAKLQEEIRSIDED